MHGGSCQKERSAAVLLPARCGAHRGEKVSRAAWLLEVDLMSRVMFLRAEKVTVPGRSPRESLSISYK